MCPSELGNTGLGALSDCLLEVVDDPADLSQWTNVFMLAKCVLGSPAMGRLLRGQEIMKSVRFPGADAELFKGGAT